MGFFLPVALAATTVLSASGKPEKLTDVTVNPPGDHGLWACKGERV